MMKKEVKQCGRDVANMVTDRDPEAEAEDKVEEEKLPGVDEDGPAAIESGFVNSAGGDWDTAAPGFTGTQASANWDGVGGEEWGASGAAPAATGGDWAGDASAAAPKESQW